MNYSPGCGAQNCGLSATCRHGKEMLKIAFFSGVCLGIMDFKMPKLSASRSYGLGLKVCFVSSLYLLLSNGSFPVCE